MTEESGSVTFQGNPLPLTGQMPAVGSAAPDCSLLANDLSAVKLSDFAGKVRVISSVPSLDTPVCDTETRRFNEAAVELGDDVVVLTVSMDLPFAQARWCGAAGVERVRTLSDHATAAFGTAYGVLIEPLRLLARAVFVVDSAGILRYRQLVKELTDEPDYQAVLDAVKSLSASPRIGGDLFASMH